MIPENRIDEFESVALAHMDDLYRTAARVLGDRSVASDIVQETYLQAWRSYDRFQAGTNCRAWLYKIMFHVIHHHRRKWFRLTTWTSDDGDRPFEETLACQPEQSDDFDRLVVSALESLPAAFREAVVLVDVQELTYKEAADALDVPIGTVMSRLSRGRKLLREQLGDYARFYGIGLVRTVGQQA